MISIKDYRLEKVIGKGSFGIVYLAKKISNDQVCAIKKIAINNISHHEKINIINEIKILTSHKCPYIIRYNTAFIYLNNLYLVTDYAQNGDLLMLINNKRDKDIKFTEDEIWHYFVQICMGIKYLHKNNIVHRDIKSANIFIDSDNNIKIGDFGIVKILKNYLMYAQTQIGTPFYMGPEIFKRERYNTKVDIWSLGCILYEMMFLRRPFNAVNIHELQTKIFIGKIDTIGCNYSDDLKLLLKSLININPRIRPSIDSIIDLPIVKKIFYKNVFRAS